jgi:putative aminopeptidase FrvX
MKSDLQLIKELVQIQKRIAWDICIYHSNQEEWGTAADRKVSESVANAYMHSHDMFCTLEGAIERLEDYSKTRSKG